MAIIKQSYILLLLLGLASLNLSACLGTQDCFIADRVWTIDKKTINNQNYSLVFIQQGGLTEKSHYIELYQGTISVNQCGNITGKKIWYEYVDYESRMPFIGIEFGNKNFTVQYADHSNSKGLAISEVLLIELPGQWPSNPSGAP